ncbi:MAG: FAD-dependent oxidoreductase, partial [Nitrospirota bacterium]|nr:FAD-dependent oxidoreductase [Nitrospirota bacterium]
KEDIQKKADIIFRAEVSEVITAKGKYRGIRLRDGREFLSDYLILSPGREGSRWLEEEAKKLDLTLLQNPVDIGVRVEVPASVMEPLTTVTYEPKLVFYSKRFDDKVRTFCVNPYGEVVKEYLKDVWTVNGHSYAERKTNNTNFALLVSTYFTEPFDEPISYGRYIARLANFIGKGVIVQRLGDLLAGRRSTPERISKGVVQPSLKDATPGDLSFVLPYRYLSNIMEMLEALDSLAPGVNSRHTLLYGVEVKFYSMKLNLSNALETEIQNIFAIGDGAGVSRGLIQASASGVVAAREISRRL